ncbi:phosphatase PAP2 family protein [Rariglobus hedericola]|uniref:Phosphatase PAP2 family protein n=1 Tax=Rariglobus hedericola TaxID=2597822 RepID=A0A556QJ67_9BACT|nr:phosphatase PAP2 family protein [Rariglobus hedericola]TSJ76694.1 phosphatase PAP2 family protein [Rariglobus hedericola]
MITRRPFIDRTLWPVFAVLAGLFLLFEFTQVDLWVQDRLYDFSAHAWMVNEKDLWPRIFFYTGPKVLIIALAAGLMTLALGPERWRVRGSFTLRRCDIWVVIATLATGPALIATSKATTNVFCPREIRRYDGFAPYVRVLESYPEGDRPSRRGRGFPAGHASGGFALLSLAGLARSRRGQLIGASIGFAVGGAMGGYQMLKGAHYLSHTVITALVCWLLFLIWRRLLKATTGNEQKLIPASS